MLRRNAKDLARLGAEAGELEARMGGLLVQIGRLALAAGELKAKAEGVARLGRRLAARALTKKVSAGT